VRTSHTKLLALPPVPMILGFDPRYQFVHEDDVVNALAHVVEHQQPGIFNVAGDGVLALSEVAGMLGKSYAPVLSPWGTGVAAAVARRLGVHIPPEMLGQLRFGRGVDNRKLKATGFRYRYTSRESVLKLSEHLRLHPILRAVEEPYRYEREVEEFLRWSPNVRDARRREDRAGSGQAAELGRGPGEAQAAPAIEGYDDLNASEIVPMVAALEPPQLAALREHERRSRDRRTVLAAIDKALVRAENGAN